MQVNSLDLSMQHVTTVQNISTPYCTKNCSVEVKLSQLTAGIALKRKNLIFKPGLFYIVHCSSLLTDS